MSFAQFATDTFIKPSAWTAPLQLTLRLGEGALILRNLSRCRCRG